MNHHPFAHDATPTEQEVFDRGVEFFSNPNASRCMIGNDGPCVYTDKKNRHCVAGYMFPNDLLDLLKDARIAVEIIANAGQKGGGIVQNIDFGDGSIVPRWVITHERLLRALQTVHDDENNWGVRKKKLNWSLKQIADARDLNFKEIVDAA